MTRTRTRTRSPSRNRVDRWLANDTLIPLGRYRLSITSAVLLTIVICGFALPADHETTVPLCVVYALSDMPCPLCGMTRASLALTHGLWADAARLHPAVFLVFPLLVVSLFVSLARDLGWRGPGPSWRKVGNIVGWLTLVLILGYGVIRLFAVAFLGREPW